MAKYFAKIKVHSRLASTSELLKIIEAMETKHKCTECVNIKASKDAMLNFTQTQTQLWYGRQVWTDLELVITDKYKVGQRFQS